MLFSLGADTEAVDLDFLFDGDRQIIAPIDHTSLQQITLLGATKIVALAVFTSKRPLSIRFNGFKVTPAPKRSLQQLWNASAFSSLIAASTRMAAMSFVRGQLLPTVLLVSLSLF